MNSIICFISVFHVLVLIQTRCFIRRRIRVLIYIGIFLPVGDYLLRIFLGDLWFYSGALVFHSIFAQALFWSIAAILHWVYVRDTKKALCFFYPLLGLAAYAVFSIFSTEKLTFLAPFSTFGVSLGWISTGYVVPLVVALFLWGTRRWSEFTEVTISRLALGGLIFFLAATGLIRQNIVGNMPPEASLAEVLTITPANIIQTEWNVVGYGKGTYTIRRYHFVQGWLGEMQQSPASDDYDKSQRALTDPLIRQAYFTAFKSPEMNSELQGEVMIVTIRELNPSTELMWVKEMQIRQNRSGQIVEFDVDYGFFF